jgi:serine/threonine protein kinase
MLYCSNPNCSSPFNPDKVKTCQTCGSQKLSSLFRHRYQIIRQLGDGGFGRTYEAKDVDKMNHLCVIKQLVPPYQDPDSLEKVKDLFQQEAKQLYELGQHPQIPELYAYFEQDKKLYLVQEFIPGQTLLSERDRDGNFSEGKIIHLLNNLLPVLKFIHDRQIIHRDIKPENIMRYSSSNQSDLVLIDFGISKQLTDFSTHPGTIIGTPGYAPIEQLSGYVSPASDISSIIQWEDILRKVTSSDCDIDDVNLNFTAVWNKQEYPIEKFLIPQGAIFKIEENDPTVQHLDFALFQIDVETTDRFNFFGIANRSCIDIGDKLYAFGYPQGMNLSIADGIVSHIYEEYTEGVDNPITQGAIQHNILINHGNSGGPTVNEFGEIVGISTRGLATSVAVGINFSLNIRVIIELIKEANNLEILDIKQYLIKLKTALAI